MPREDRCNSTDDRQAARRVAYDDGPHSVARKEAHPGFVRATFHDAGTTVRPARDGPASSSFWDDTSRYKPHNLRRRSRCYPHAETYIVCLRPTIAGRRKSGDIASPRYCFVLQFTLRNPGRSGGTCRTTAGGRIDGSFLVSTTPAEDKSGLTRVLWRSARQALVKYHLILTLDYETFGNGSGSLCHCIVQPVERLLTTLSEFDAGLQSFVDATEFAAMRAHANEEVDGLPFEVQWLDRVESQIAALMTAPHSVHLHIHPQWMDARLDDDAWTLNYQHWRIGDLSEPEIDRSVAAGLDYLARLGDQFPEQGTTCFRAGGWAIQPSKPVLSSLEKHGVRIDSTVAPGTMNLARGDWFNFRKAPAKPFWHTGGDVLVESAAGFLEVPIATARLGRRQHIRCLRESKKYGGLPSGCVGTYKGPNNRWQSLAGKLSKLANLGTVMLDYSTMPAWALIEITRDHIERFSETDGAIPIVAIGHNKNFSKWSEDNLREFLEWARLQPDVVFSSYSRWNEEKTAKRVSDR